MLKIIFFILILAFLYNKLQNLFGKENGNDELREKYSSKYSAFFYDSNDENNENYDQKTVDVEANDPNDNVKSLTHESSQLQKIKELIPTFDLEKFLNSAEKAYCYIIESVSKTNFDDLKELLTDRIFENFKTESEKLNQQNQRLFNTNIRIIEKKISGIDISDPIIKIAISFSSERCCYLTDSLTNEIIRGNNNLLTHFDETWTFEKNKNDKSNIWKVSKIIEN